jgi:PAS domain S-box-containing protein
MKDQRKTKKQLIEELTALRRKFEASQRGGRRAKQSPPGEALRQRVAITEAMGDGLILFAMDGTVLDVNPAYEKLTGLRKKEVVGRPGVEVAQKTVAPKELAKIVAAFGKAISGKPIPPVETVMMDRKGRQSPVYFTTTFLKDESGKPASILSVIKNIAPLVESERALQESEEKYRILAERSPMGIVIMDREKMRTIFANRAACRITGYSEKELSRIPITQWSQMVHHQDRPAAAERAKRILSGKKVPADFQYRLIRKDGQVRWLETNSAAITYSGKTATQIVMIDITERKQYEEELLRRQHLYHAVVEDQTELICRFSPDGKLTFVNEAYCRYFKRKPEELVGRKFTPLIVRKHRHDVMNRIARLSRKRPIETHEEQIIAPDGSIHWQQWTNRAIFDKDGRLIEYQAVGRDITELKNVEKELREHRNRLEEMVIERTTELEESRQQAQAQYKGIPVPTYTWQRKGRDFELIDYNDAAEKITEGKIKNYLGTLASKLYKDDPLIRRELRRCYREKISFDRQMFYHMKSTGQDKHFHVRYAYAPPDLVLVHTEDITERQRDEEEVRKFKTISDRAAYGTAISDLQGRLLYVNETFARMHGYGAEDLIGKHLSIFHTREQLKDVDRLNRRLKRDGSYTAQEVWHKRKDGSVFPTLMSATIIKDEKGKAEFLAATAIDITERKRTQEEIKKQTVLLDEVFCNIQEGIGIVDEKEQIIFCNPAFEKIFEQGSGQLIGRSLFDLFPSEANEIISKQNRERRKGEFSTYELPLVTPGGKHKRLLVTASPRYDKKGGYRGAFGAVLDITERVRIEEELRESRERLQIIFDFAPEAYYLTDTGGRFIDGNRAAEEMSGYGKEELIGKTMIESQLLLQEEIPKAIRILDKNRRGDPTGPVEFTIRRKDGRHVTLEISSYPTTIKGERLILNIARDITEGKEYERKLKDSEERFRTTFEQVAVGMSHVALDGHFIRVNKKICDIVGYSQPELLKRRFQDITHPHDLETNLEFTRQLLNGEISQLTMEKRYIHKDGYPVWVHLTATLIRDSSGRPEYYICVIEDIGVRKWTEEELIHSEERLKILFEYAPDGYFSLDTHGQLLDCNRAAEELTGYSKKELTEKNILRSKLLMEEELSKWAAYLEELAHGRSLGSQEFTFIHKGGTKVFVELSAFPVEIDSQIQILLIVHDVTRRKENEIALRNAENLLRKSRETIRSLMNATEDSAILTDTEGRILALNEAAARRFGRPMEDLIGINAYTLMPPGLAKSRGAQFRRAIKTKQPIQFKDRRGDTHFHSTIFPVIDAKGQVTQVATYGRDITEEVKSKESLQQSEQKYRELTELLPVIVFEIDLKGNVITTNRAGLEAFGYTREDIDKGLKVNRLYDPRDRQRIRENIAKRLRGEPFEDHEYMALRKDGTTFPVIIYSSPIVRNGKPCGLRGIVVDITERKQMLDELQESEEKFKGIAENASDVIFRTDLGGRITYVSKMFKEMFGVPPEKAEGRLFHVFLPNKEIPRAIAAFTNVLKGGTARNFQLDMAREDKTVFPGELSATTMIRDGKVVGAQGIIRNISERTRTREEIERLGQRYKDIVNLIPDAIITVDTKGTVTTCNEMVLKQYGLREDDILNRPFWDSPVMDPDRRNEYKKFFRNLMRGRTPKPFEVEWIAPRGRTHIIEIRTRFLRKGRKKTGLQAILRDVTAERRARMDLKRSEDRLRSLVETAPDGIYTIDLEGRITSCNTTALTIGGHTRKSELVGKKFTELKAFRKTDTAELQEKFAAALRGEDIPPYEFPFQHKDGSVHWAEGRYSLLKEDGKTVGILAVIREVTERKREEEVQGTLNRISDAVHTSADLEQLYQVIHRQLSDFLKIGNISICLYDREKHLLSIEFHHDEKDHFEGHVPAGKSLTAYMIKRNKPLLLTAKKIRELKRAGTVKPLGAATRAWMGVPLRIGGETFGALIVNDYRSEQAFDRHDLRFLELVSDTVALSIQRKQTEMALKESEELFHTLAEQSPYMIWVNAMGPIIYVNKRCQQVFGYKRKDFYTEDFDFLTLVTPESGQLAKKNLAEHRKGREVPPAEYTFITRRGRKFRALQATTLINYRGRRAILGIIMNGK